VLVGARAPLAAFNLVLDTADVSVAQAVAAAARGSSGGMPGVQAIGLLLPSTGRVQVSMNVIDLDAAPLHEVVARVRAEARARGAEVVEGELVGLLLARVVRAAAAAAGIPGSDDDLPGPSARAAAARTLSLVELPADRIVESYL
jgi:glutamate formiminotransferase